MPQASDYALDLSFFQGKEKWVGDFLSALPWYSWLRLYVYTAAHVTDANAVHHVLGGLILLTQTMPECAITLSDGRTHSNIYGLCTASSGARKTECVKVAEIVAKKAVLPTVVTTAPGSREGFIDSLDARYGGHPRQALVYEEFAEFLGISASATGGRFAGHAQSMRAAIMNVYDGGNGQRRLAGRRDTKTGRVNEEVRGAAEPRVSLLGTANYRILTENCTADDWLDGFMGRFLLLEGELERWYLKAPPLHPFLGSLASELRFRADLARQQFASDSNIFGKSFPEPGYNDLDEAAYALFARWATAMHMRERDENMIVAAAMTRIASLALRVAMILSWDFGEAGGLHGDFGERHTEPGWRITSAEMYPAILVADRHLESYRYAVSNVVLTPEEAPIRAVEQALRQADNYNRALTIGEISLATSRTKKTVEAALDTLIERGVVGYPPRKREGTTKSEYVIKDGVVEKVRHLPPQAPPDLFSKGG